MIFEILSLETIVAFVLASVVLSLVPGPDNIFVMTNSALKGWKSGFYITLGLCTGLIRPHNPRCYWCQRYISDECACL